MEGGPKNAEKSPRQTDRGGKFSFTLRERRLLWIFHNDPSHTLITTFALLSNGFLPAAHSSPESTFKVRREVASEEGEEGKTCPPCACAQHL